MAGAIDGYNALAEMPNQLAADQVSAHAGLLP